MCSAVNCTVDVGIAKVTKGLRGGASKVTFFLKQRLVNPREIKLAKCTSVHCSKSTGRKSVKFHLCAVHCTVDVGIAKVTNRLRGGASKVTFFILLKSHFSFFFWLLAIELWSFHKYVDAWICCCKKKKKYFFLIFKTVQCTLIRKNIINKIQIANRAILIKTKVH